MPRLPALLALSLLLALPACASNPRPADSGFLGGPLSYERLAEVEGVDGLWVWRNPWNPGAFAGAIVSPVEVRPGGGGPLAPADLEVAQSLADHFQAEVQRVTAATFPNTAGPGPDALIVMAAVIGMDPARPAANLAPAGRSSDERERAAHVEMKIVDGGTGALLGALVAVEPPPPADALQDPPPPNTRAILTRWATLLGRYLLGGR